MSTDSALFSVTLDAVKNLADSGTHLVGAEKFASLTNSTAQDWARFAENWEDLELDTYMADGGTYRFRRYDQFVIDVEAERLILLQHGPYRQEADVNKLNGGIDRVYEPLTAGFLDDPLFRKVLMELALIFSGVEDVKKWNIKVTPIRITATQDQAGLPTPEGRHKDGATFITALLLGRTNVVGGDSSVYTEDGECLITTQLSEPGEILLSDDRTTLHEVTSVHPERVGEPAHRDVLIMAYTEL
ncbi:hypothetical protein ABIA35_004577 [Catenulispora sp. MAP12-49]|uniref:2OG-Fe dioxygenase family protein n=1 Tax=Catenulispora sp. MAP12-49 TaxID=3156302 RepID=UPI003511C6E2